MWEWGNFPQPSPLKPTFSKSGRVESPSFLKSGSGERWRPKQKTMHVRKGRLGGLRLPVLEDSDEEEEQDGSRSDDEDQSRGRTFLDTDHGRSHSVPPHLQGAQPSSRKADRRRWKEYEDSREEGDVETSRRSRRSKEEGGRISASKHDSSKFILSIEGQRVGFQLSLAGTFRLNEDAFEQHLVDFERFLYDESIVSSPDLVVRWVGGDQYVIFCFLLAFHH
jgi:phosphatidate phosphatase LPIN